MSNINDILVRALYEKYAPEKDVNTQINFVNQNYDSQDKFVEDFYKNYNIELTDDIKRFIKINFGGFGITADPTIDLDESGLEFDEKTAEFITAGTLTKSEEAQVTKRFGTNENPNFDYLTLPVYKLAPTGENIFEKGTNINTYNQEVVATDKLQVYEDLKLTETEVKYEIAKQKDILIDPYSEKAQKYFKLVGLDPDTEADFINEWKLNNLGDDPVRGNVILEREAKKRTLSLYRNMYTNKLVSRKQNLHFLDEEDYFRPGLEQSLEYKGEEATNQEVKRDLFFQNFGVGPNFLAKYGMRRADNKRLLSDQSIVKLDIKEFNDFTEKYKAEFDKNEKLGQIVLDYQKRTQEEGFVFDPNEYDKMEQNLAVYNANAQYLAGLGSRLQLAAKDMHLASVAGDLLGKDYDLLRKSIATTALGFGGFGMGGLRILSGIGGSVGINSKEAMDKLSLKWDNYYARRINSYAPDITFEDAFKSDRNFGRWFAQEVSTQIPVFSLMLASGGLAGLGFRTLASRGIISKTTLQGSTNILGKSFTNMGLVQATGSGLGIGIASGGEQYNRMTVQEMRDPFLETSFAEKFLISAGYGAAEGAFGTAPSYFFLRNTYKSLLKAGGKKELNYKLGMRQFFKEYVAAPMLAESVTEGLTTVTQNMLLDRPLMENVDHAMFSGAMFSFIMNAAPAIGGRIMADFSTLEQYNAFKQINAEIDAITKTLNRTTKNKDLIKQLEGQLYGAEYFGLDDSGKKVKKRSKGLLQERIEMMNDLQNNIQQNVDDVTFRRHMEAQTRKHEIQAEMQLLVDKEGETFMGARSRKRMQKLQKELAKIQQGIDLFQAQAEFGNEFNLLQSTDPEIHAAYENKAKKQLRLEGIKDPSPSQVFDTASNLYFEETFDANIKRLAANKIYKQNQKTNKINKLMVFATNEEAIEYLNENHKEEANKKSGPMYVFQNGRFIKKTGSVIDRIKNGDLNGFYINSSGVQMVMRQNALANQKRGTGFHELSHGMVAEMVKNLDPEKLNLLAKQIILHLKATDPKLARKMFSSASLSKVATPTLVKGKDGEIDVMYTPKEAEEVIVAFMEEVANRRIKDFKFMGLTAVSLKQAAGLDINFKGAYDSVGFLYDMAVKIQKGEIDFKFVQESEAKMREMIGKADKAVKELDFGKASENKTDADLVQDLYDKMGPEAAAPIANNKYIRKIIKEISNKYSQVPKYATYKQDFEAALVNDPIYGILGSLLTYDSKKNPVLASHIIARLRQRSKTIAEDIFPQFFSDDPKDTGYDPTDPEILNQRESLRITLGLSPEIIDRVKQAVIKTFGTRLPKVGSKKFKKALQTAFRTELKTLINNYIGTTSETVKIDDETSVQVNAYELLLDEYFETIYGVISQGNINKRFEQFKQEVIDPKKGKRARESTAQGNTIFIKRDITKEEWINYFLGDDVKASTKGTRKTALAESLAEEIAFDATLTVLRDGMPINKAGMTLLEKVEQIVEINGEQFSENYLAQVAKEIDRATDFKFSDSGQGITVLDFDDTVAISKSKVIVNMPDKTKKELTPAEFAKQHDALKKDGAKFDFSQFNKVIGGEKGPLFGRLQKAVNKFGNKNVFILTARPQEAAPAIKAWLKSQGIALSEKNIVGLSDGSPEAKADWILGKAKEGFDNFYFADDVLENTYAVEQVLSQVDVKYRVDQALGKFSENKANMIKLLESFDGNMGTFVEFFEALIEGQKKYNDITAKEIKDAKGQALEYYVAMEVKGLLSDRVEVVNMDSLKQLKTGDTGIDIRFKIDGGKEFGMEIKNQFTDKVGSKTGYDGASKVLGKDALVQIKDAHEVLLKRVTDVLDKLNIEYYIDKDNDNKLYTESYINGKKIDILLAENGVVFSDQQLNFTIPGLDNVAKIYGEKGGSYINFNDVGIFSLEQDPVLMGKVKNWLGWKTGGVRSIIGLTDKKGNMFNTEVQPTLKTGKGGNIFYNKKSGKKLKAKDVRTFFARSFFYIQKSDGARAKASDIDPSINVNEAFGKMSETKVNLDNEINNIIEKSTTAQGKTVKNIVRYSDTKARLMGKDKGKGGVIFKFTADDLKGFTYEIMKGIRGKEGNDAIAFFDEHLHRPYDAGFQGMALEQTYLMENFKALKKKFPNVPKRIKNKIDGGPYTNDMAIRVYLWNKQGMDIPGIPKKDIQDLVRHVKNDLSLQTFADELHAIQRTDGYPEPTEYWEATNIEIDLYEGLNSVKRKKHFKQWEENVNIIFSPKNLNKIEAVYGSEFVKNLKDMLERMRTGKNRKASNTPGGKLVQDYQNWINGATGVIMFYNMRSALLQTISTINYINWHDNNPYKAGKAFANQPQFWTDWLMIFNSDYLKVRRAGLKLNVTESELADMAEQKGVRGVIGLLLKNGFAPTRIADSFAIASGGATMYRNRVNTYLKKGMNQKQSEKKAFEDFMKITEESQQSSRPDKISAEQASDLGRIMLAFANTPMQYNRLIKRAGQDLYYGRGDWKTNVSKIGYYSMVQNFIFNALQKGLYALGFGLDEDEPEKQKERTTKVAEGMADSLLSGLGTTGKWALVAKGILQDLAKERMGYTETYWENFLQLSPPMGSKFKKWQSAEYLFDKYKDSKQAQELSLRNPYLMAYANYASAVFNIPLDRALRKIHNLESVMADDTEDWQKAALFLGWNEWDVGVDGYTRTTYGKDPIKTDEYVKERTETKEEHKIKIDSIENLGYTRIPLSGPRSFEPEGKPGVDYIRLKRKLDGRYEYFVPKEVFDKKFPPKVKTPKRPKTEAEKYQESIERLKKKGITLKY